jgi:steroid delta-isomerase-like uncharacterized protein
MTLDGRVARDGAPKPWKCLFRIGNWALPHSHEYDGRDSPSTHGQVPAIFDQGAAARWRRRRASHTRRMDTADLIRDYYRCFNTGDREAFLALLMPDVIHDLNQGPREVGIEAFRVFLQRMDRCYRERIADVVVSVSADGSRAAAEYVVHGTYLATDDGLPPAQGQTYVLPGGAFFAIRAGRIGRVTNAYNLQDWLRQIRSAAVTR